MTRVHTDLSRVAISVAPSPATSGTSLGVTDANAAYLPDTYPFWAVLVPVNAAPTRANSEIVKVTAGSSSAGTTTYTIVRAQGTPVTTAKTVTTSFDIYDANSTEALGTVLSIVENETPGGSINSSNTSFTSAASMVSGSLKVYQNGVRLSGGGVDFTQGSGTAFTMVTAPTTGDILLIDYKVSAGTYSTGSTSFVYDETPSGTINSSNVTFTIASTPVSGSLILYRDGQRLIAGGADYTLSGTTITFVTAPTTGSTLKVDYQSAVSAAGNADTVDGIHANDLGGTDAQLVADYGGWKKAPGSWTYASASTITVTTGAASVYGKGDRIRWKQGGAYKYGVIVTVADTLLTIAVNTDYTVANSAITDIYFSHEANPLGYPHWFNWTTSWAGFSANPTGTFIYSIIGNMCSIYYIDGSTGTSNATSLTFTGPVPALKTAIMAHVLFAKDNGSNLTTPSHLATTATSATITAYKSFAAAAWTNTGSKDLYIGLFSYAF